MGSDIDLTESIREFAIERLGVDLFGVAPVGRFEGGPKEGRPTDYLPHALSVIVCALKIPDAVIEVAGHYEEPGKTLGPYMWYGYVALNWDLSSAARRLVRFLEERVLKACPFHLQGCCINMEPGRTFHIDMRRLLPAWVNSELAVFC